MTTNFASGNALSEQFSKACNDYRFLLDRHYPERSVLKLVGDRYKLTGDHRTVLYRGISSCSKSLLRKSILTDEINGKILLIDGYNVLFTLFNYRRGKILFISTDHILRDAGSLHGKFKDDRVFTDCIRLLFEFLVENTPSYTGIYLDSPVSHSEKHARIMNDNLVESQLTGECFVIKSADWALRKAKESIIATSDTGIIEKALLPVIDLPRLILQKKYHADFLDLNGLLSSNEIENPVDKG